MLTVIILVMRGKTALIIRLICSLALVVAVWPAKASVESSAVRTLSTIVAPQGMSDCGMPCCETKLDAKTMVCDEHAAQSLACCKERASSVNRHAHEVAPTSGACKCEIKSAPNAPNEAPKALVTSFDSYGLVAVLPDVLPELPTDLKVEEPSLVGINSGFPASTPHPSDFGRAPPVAVGHAREL